MNFDTDEELCACFIDRQKACDCAKWTKLMQILKGTGIDCYEKSLDQSVKVQLDQGETKRVKIGRGVRQGDCWSLILFNLLNLYCKYLTKEALEESEDGKKEDK